VRRFEKRPKQPAHAHAAEKLQCITVGPGLVWQFGEVASARRSSRADQYVTTIKFIPDTVENLLTAPQRAQIRSDGQRRGPYRVDYLGSFGEIVGRRRNDDGLRAERASSSAISRPIPRLPPVTTAILFESSPKCLLLSFN
jgi:hypothetical protein